MGKPVLVSEYLHTVQERLTSESDDGWLVHIETDVEYTLETDGSVKRKGGTFLISKAHGTIASLTLVDDPELGEVVKDVEPGNQITWAIAKILIGSAR